MEILAKSSFVRASPQKLRLVAEKICGQKAKLALTFLSQAGKKGKVLKETLKQGIANAKNNFNLAEEDLKIKEIQINEGPIYKRWQPVSRGQAHPIKKRTSHIMIVLEAPEKVEKGKKSGAKS